MTKIFEAETVSLDTRIYNVLLIFSGKCREYLLNPISINVEKCLFNWEYHGLFRIWALPVPLAAIGVRLHYHRFNFFPFDLIINSCPNRRPSSESPLFLMFCLHINSPGKCTEFSFGFRLLFLALIGGFYAMRSQ